MTAKLVDVVNFNADASCLSSDRWLSMLTGGENSELCKWLGLYVELNKKVVLGFPGATVADIGELNPEAINIINSNSDIFQIVLRPFSHDLGLLRNTDGFVLNSSIGIEIIKITFKNVSNFYLAPEFMLTDEQIYLLCNAGVEGTFVNPNRYSATLRNRIPDFIYNVDGILNAELVCIPFVENGAMHYLEAIQLYDVSSWNYLIEASKNEYIFNWRDGESPFFLPNSIQRERYWLMAESHKIQRAHLNIESHKVSVTMPLTGNKLLHTYPVHSCLSWMQEFRMMGFIARLLAIEKNLKNLDFEKLVFWLLAINSDILSSIEKDSPNVAIKDFPNSVQTNTLTLYRTERWHEGIEYLHCLESSFIKNFEFKCHSKSSALPAYVKKAKIRYNYLTSKRLILEKLNGLNYY